MKRIFLTVVIALLSIAGGHAFVSRGLVTPSYPTDNPWFYGATDVLPTFLAQSKPAGIGIVNTGSNDLSTQVPEIIASGYKSLQGIGNYFIDCANGITNPGKCGGSPPTGGLAYAESYIDGLVSDGVMWIYINEPNLDYNDMTPASSSFTANAPWISGATSLTVQGSSPLWIASGVAAGYSLQLWDTAYSPPKFVGFVNSVSGSSPFILGFTPPIPPVASSGSHDALAIYDTSSVPYNVTNSNILFNYIHLNHPGVKYGYVMDLPTSDDWKILFYNGFLSDFAGQELDYWSVADVGDYWADLHAAYPSVLRMSIVEGVNAFCSESSMSMTSGQVDILGYWDIDNYGPWGYPWMSPTMLQVVTDYATTGDKSIYCRQPNSLIGVSSWDPITPVTATQSIQDLTHFNGWTAQWSLTSCDYRVYSGPSAKAANGIVEYNGSTIIDPGMTLTRDWTTRTCNGAITITFGASNDCRDETTYPFTGYIDSGSPGVAGTTMHIVTGSIQGKAVVTGSGVSANTQIVSYAGNGGAGSTVTINNSQLIGSAGSPVSLSAYYGDRTCLVEARTHNNSPGGVGVPSYYQYSVAFPP